MTDLLRPVPRWLHVWAVVTVVATLVLLAIGQLVTSFAAGMADPLWPTEPWYVFHTATPSEKTRFRSESSYFLEHSHRIAAFTVGGLVVVLALGLWGTEPRKVARWVAIGGVIVLLGGFGEFHREMMVQNKLIQDGTLSKADIRLPVRGASVALAGLAVALAVGLSGLRARGGILRLLGTLALAAVMVQGLLGGVRVLLNELIGPDLAKIHGIFAQIVLALLTTIAVLTARAPDRRDPGARSFRSWAVALAALVFTQVVLGAFVRHDPTPLTQRLHMLTAFAVTGFALWFLRGAFADPGVRARMGVFGWGLALLLVLQVYLGVEAWMLKFGGGGPLSEAVKLTPHYVTMRTAHALVGSGLWAVSLILALRLWGPTKAPINTLETHVSDRAAGHASAPVRTPEAVVTGLRGDAR
jgi:heme A synthase